MWPALDLILPASCCGCGAAPQPRRIWCAPCRSLLALTDVALPVEGIRASYASAPYHSEIGAALRRAKYGRDHGLMIALADAFSPICAPVAYGADAIVAAPSPWTRRIARGFAPASVLAASLSRQTAIPVLHPLSMARGARQAGLGRTARARNLTSRIRASGTVSGRILLVDDVLTTGATAAACARELLGSGADDVTLCVLAYAETERASP